MLKIRSAQAAVWEILKFPFNCMQCDTVPTSKKDIIKLYFKNKLNNSNMCNKKYRIKYVQYVYEYR